MLSCVVEVYAMISISTMRLVDRWLGVPDNVYFLVFEENRFFLRCYEANPAGKRACK